MNTILVYCMDAAGLFTVSREQHDTDPLPVPCTLVAPPPGEFVQWYDGQWRVLDAAPEAPMPTVTQHVPASVTRAQGKMALIHAQLWPQVSAFVDAIGDPTERALAEVALYDTGTWQRTSPFLNTMADALGLSQAQLDELFIAAAQIEV